MNKILSKLTANCIKSIEENEEKDYKEICGNYKIEYYSSVKTIMHFYYGTIICDVDLKRGKYYIYNGSYSSYRLTKSQLNFLDNYYSNYDLFFGGNFE